MGEQHPSDYAPRHTTKMREARSILIINPNATTSMTDGLRPLVDALHFKDVVPPPARAVPR